MTARSLYCLVGRSRSVSKSGEETKQQGIKPGVTGLQRSPLRLLPLPPLRVPTVSPPPTPAVPSLTPSSPGPPVAVTPPGHPTGPRHQAVRHSPAVEVPASPDGTRLVKAPDFLGILGRESSCY